MAALIAFLLWVAGLAVLLVAVFPVAARVNLVALGLLLIFLALLILTYQGGSFDGWPSAQGT